MSEPHGSTEDQDEPGRYEIRLKGHLDARWANRFEGLSLSYGSDGTTVLSGPVERWRFWSFRLRRMRCLRACTTFIRIACSPQLAV